MALNQKERDRAWIYFNELFGGKARCIFCLTTGDETGNRLTLDHIIPQAIEGCDEIYNLQPLCSICHQLRNLIQNTRGLAGFEAIRDAGLRTHETNAAGLEATTRQLQGA